ncbi:hypothetical protein RTM1035_11370 [Roseovarius sp. TM1035]|nr:hypothetical protein RTM1035_11370 [Roseovarius sp. TM1035]
MEMISHVFYYTIPIVVVSALDRLDHLDRVEFKKLSRSKWSTWFNGGERQTTSLALTGPGQIVT